MALIDRFPTTGWKNNNLKETIQKLLELEDDFTARKAPATLGSILLTLATVYKDDANQIAIILAKPVAVVNRQPVRQINPNPNSEAFTEGCETCGGGKVKQIIPLADVIVDTNPNIVQANITETVNQVVGTETLIVSKEHETSGWKNADDVWKFFSGDIAKLQEAAKAIGVKNAMYDSNAQSLSRKIFAAQNKQ